MVERGPTTEPARESKTILSRDFVDVIMHGARENLANQGSLGTTLFVLFDDGERSVIPLNLPPTHEEKRVCFTFLGLSLLETGRQINEAILVAESWIVEISESDSPPDVVPSQHPQRKEAITLAGRDHLAQKFAFAIQPFQRDPENQPVFEPLVLEQYEEEPDSSYYSTGLLDNLFLEGSNHLIC